MDKALKQRLVGASVLVAAAVVVLPMLLSGQPDSQPESRSIELPARPPDLSIETRRFPIGEQADGEPSTVPDQSPPASTPRTPDEAVAGETAPTRSGPERTASGEAEEGSIPADAAELAEADDPPAGGEPGETPGSGDGARYLVQVASFSTMTNATRLAGLLRESAMPVLMDTVETEAGLLHRVRIGPYAAREDADAAIAALNARMPDLSPRLLDLAPTEGAPVTDPSDPLVRWVVQVGSFAQPDNADTLVYRLRDAGYRASSTAVSDAGGTVYKVRVGPLVERQEALRMQESIQQELGIDGLVMSAD